jgi:hypothetical protein
MRSVEREIADAVTKRLARPAAPQPDLIHQIEDFAVSHMKSLAFGTAGAVIALSAMLAVSDGGTSGFAPDPVIVGSIQDRSRAPGLSTWQAVRKPVELFALQAPQFQRHPAQYQARANAAGDREDALVFEPNATELPEAKVILRRSAAPRDMPSLFIDMTRQQAERGVAVTRAGASGKLATKFGDLDVADMTFTDVSGQHQSCLAFRSEGTIGLGGWFCAAAGAAVERPELGCFIDRLALLKSGEDKELRRYFAEAEQRRRPCPSMRVSTGRKPTWLDSDGKAPAMRDITGSIGDRPKR